MDPNVLIVGLILAELIGSLLGLAVLQFRAGLGSDKTVPSCTPQLGDNSNTHTHTHVISDAFWIILGIFKWGEHHDGGRKKQFSLSPE